MTDATPQNIFPGGSKGRVNRAGANISAGHGSSEDVTVLDTWRSAHRAVLNTFQASLRMRTKGTDIVVAQRHKRKNTIIDKLSRIPGMKLARMDDVAGCRFIFEDIESLYAFRESFLKARFRHTKRNDIDKYDYIKRPKATGYRGIHDVYEYNVRSKTGAHLKGLLIELQYRTRIQHAWATTVEVIGHITNSQPKFERGDTRYQDAMVFASEILARAHEQHKGARPDLPDREVVRSFKALDREIHLTHALRGLNQSQLVKSANRNAILVFREDGKLEITTFRSAPEALDHLFKLEAEHPELDVVLVRADTSEEVRFAYKNYFSDAQDFLDLLETGMNQLGSRTKR